MRLDRVYIDGFKNLKEVEVDFDESRLTTVIIGQNGCGKSNLIEAIVDVFRHVDAGGDPLRYTYEIDYRIAGRRVRLTNRGDDSRIELDGAPLRRSRFEASRRDYFPDLVFGYYSGGSDRLERLFDWHQRRYYRVISKERSEAEYEKARTARRLFYCRPIHGALALLATFAFLDESSDKVAKELKDKLNVLRFHSALAHFKRPSWSKRAKSSSVAGESASPIQALQLWGALGPAGVCARKLLEVAFHPISLVDRVVSDYREARQREEQLACYIRNEEALRRLAGAFKDDRDLFAALEAADISGLYRDFQVWVERVDDKTGDIGFADLSDGERQLLMVLGLIRVSRGQRALFLLDEPDTHLNPVWQHTYLDLIQEWTGVTADARDCHIILTSHNPLTIAALRKEEVRVMTRDEETSRVEVREPYTDPRGLGFTATLTEIFGLPTSLDVETQRQLDLRNSLARIERRNEDQDRQLKTINDQLKRLGFMFEDREPLYQDFLRAWADVRYADRPVLSPEQLELQRKAMASVIRQLVSKGGTAH